VNLSDRIYAAVHVALTLLVLVRAGRVEHWPWYVAWNAACLMAIVVLARNAHRGRAWEFAHDWLPSVFFVSVFEEVAWLASAVGSQWRESILISAEQRLFGVVPNVWLPAFAVRISSELLNLGYLLYYPLYPAVAGYLWIQRHQDRFRNGFRAMTDACSVGYLACYATYLLFPTRSPHHAFPSMPDRELTGVFGRVIGWVQGGAGVYGNAFPSAHIMLSFAIMVFVFRYSRGWGWVVLAVNLLMSAGAVHSGYHYVSDVVIGAAIGLAAGIVFLPRVSRVT